MNCEGISIQFSFKTKVDSIDIKYFILTKMNETRKVAHLHYSSWPDFGVPSSTREILNLVRLTEILRSEAPIVVHCSAGIGRSGTFIGIHPAICMLKRGKQPNIFDLVLSMRSCRCAMVQTREQYSFIYKVIHDYEVDCSQGLYNDIPVGKQVEELSCCSLDSFKEVKLR